MQKERDDQQIFISASHNIGTGYFDAYPLELKKKSKKSCCEKFRKGKRCKSCPFADREGTLHLAKPVSGTQIGGRVIQIST